MPNTYVPQDTFWITGQECTLIYIINSGKCKTLNVSTANDVSDNTALLDAIARHFEGSISGVYVAGTTLSPTTSIFIKIKEV